MKIQNILKELRQERNLTQKQLAEKLGYSKAIIGFWENGINQPTAEALIAMADFFDVSLDYLCARTDAENINEFYVSPSLSNEEREVLKYYNQLSKTNKIILNGYIRGLAEGQADVGNISKRGD